MGFLTPDAPRVEAVKPPPPGPRNRADPSITLAGLRVGRAGIGSLSQQAATAFKSGGLLGDTRGGRRKRTLIGGAT